MKIEIDVSERSLEEQVAAACATVRYDTDGQAARLLRDFAAGKFARAPMPEIVKPKWADNVRIAVLGDRGNSYVTASANDGDISAIGPTKPTQREAILAFNELFGGAS